MNVLEELHDAHNQCNRLTTKLIDMLCDFEDKHELPIGISIDDVEVDLLRVGIVRVRMVPRCKDLWDSEFHSVFCGVLGLKLVKIVEESVFFSDGSRKLYFYEYSFRGNVRFDEIVV